MTLPRLAAVLLAALSIATGYPSQQAQSQWAKDILQFENMDSRFPPAKGGVVFIGSSSIAGWRTLKQDFPEHNVINRGFGGSHLSDSVEFAQRIVTPYEPKLVVLFAGTNDIASGKTAETVFSDYQAFIAKVQAKLPKARIAYISISPAPSRWNKLEEIKKANRLIRDYTLKDRNLIFIDTFSSMVTDTGGPRPELFVEDQLHLSPQGYAIWKDAVAPFLPWGSN
jgi:lysophospholipase L1-like esterase